MIDRTINLATLFIFLFALIIFCFNLYIFWGESESWEKVWVSTEQSPQEISAEQMITAIKGARDAEAYSDIYRFEELLKENYRFTGEITVRLNMTELSLTLLYTCITLLLLLVPLSLNYVRHGIFKIWNKHA